ncbi:MAG: nonstructural protein [Microviridae sp.]|nr:MAG: nonstructural protein [Microviridae sp.]
MIGGSEMRQLYSLYDLKAQTIVGGLVIENRDGPAIRAFQDAVLDSSSSISKHREDYVLLCIGSIDDQGTLVPAANITTVAWGEHYMEETK